MDLLISKKTVSGILFYLASFYFILLTFSFPIQYQVVLALGDYMSVQCHACIGGTNIGEDIRKLDYGQHIVSGTPGRVFG